MGVLLKKLACGSFCSPVSIVVCFKWDANVIYNAWHDAVREHGTLQGNADLSGEGLRVSNMFLWVTKERTSVASSETRSK